jgi:glucuronoarabinoxylan endo-1,4-beta-xylanase
MTLKIRRPLSPDLKAFTSRPALLLCGLLCAGPALLISGCGGGGSSPSGSGGTGGGGTPPSGAVTVDFTAQDQIIRVFGGATGFLAQLTTAQANALFNPTSGLGLSILRVMIDPAGQNNAAPASAYGYAVNWSAETGSASAALAANPNTLVFASPYTPPTSMKLSSTTQPYYSGSPACPLGQTYCGGYLNPANYADYAAYLNAFVAYFNANSGTKLYALSMQNEPDYSAQAGENYESCSWTPTQMDQWLDAEGSAITVPLMMPESTSFDPAQAAPSLQDARAAGAIGIVAGHLYMNGESQGTPTYYAQAVNAGKEVWMTEHYLAPTADYPAQPGISDALNAAEEIQNSMVTGQYNAYVWYRMWNDTCAYVNYGLIDSGVGGNAACSNTTAQPRPTYYGYAVGQFAKFIQPGYHRFNATASPSAGVSVSAYSGSENGATHYVIVAINAGAASSSQTFTLQGATVTSVTPWQTTSTGGLVQQSAVTVSNGAFTYALPAQSITTFVE